MYTTNLRKVGGSIMLTLPPAFLEQLKLQAGSTLGLSVENGNLVINPQPKPHYTLTQLLAASDYTQVDPQEDQEWTAGEAIGKELI